MKFTEDDTSAMIAGSRVACKRLQKLGMVWQTVATHRLKELRHLRAVENSQPGGEIMGSIDVMYAMISGFTAPYPPHWNKLP